MFSRGALDLGGGGEMDEAVARIVGAAAIDALPFGLAPGRGRADLVDEGHVSEPVKLLVMFVKSLLGASWSLSNFQPYRRALFNSRAAAQPLVGLMEKRFIQALIPKPNCQGRWLRWPGKPERRGY